MIKVISRIDPAKLKPSSANLTKFWAPKAKNRKDRTDTKVLTRYGNLSHTKCSEICGRLNQKDRQYFYYPVPKE